MFNKEIRQFAKKNNVYLWQIADELRIRDTEFSRRLRRELPEKDKQEIISIIERLSARFTAREA